MINQYLPEGTTVYVPHGTSLYITEQPVWVGKVQCPDCNDTCQTLSRGDQIAVLMFCLISSLYVLFIATK